MQEAQETIQKGDKSKPTSTSETERRKDTTAIAGMVDKRIQV
jgi:hypothetical protein